MIKVITKITTNNYQNSNSKNKKTIKSPPYAQKSVLKMYQSYKNKDAQHIDNKTARHFLQH